MTQDRWADLPLRLASAIVLLLIFSASLYFGRPGVLTLGLGALVAMQWELARMFGLKAWRLLAVAVVAALTWLPMAAQPMVLTQSLMPALVAGFSPIILGVAFVGHNRMIYIAYGALMTIGMLSFWFLALTFGVRGILILAAVVIMSDIGGYIAGRWLGGRQVLASDQSEKNLEWDHGRMALGRSFGSLSHAGNGRLVGRSGRDHRGFWRADG